MKKKKKSIGQITVKKIGKKYAVCIAGTPERLFTSQDKAKEKALNLRKKYGRRSYDKYKSKRNKKA